MARYTDVRDDLRPFADSVSRCCRRSVANDQRNDPECRGGIPADRFHPYRGNQPERLLGFECRRKFVASTGRNRNPSIQFTPSSGGIREATLLVFSDDPTLEIASIPLRGVGTSGPQITVIDTISFGLVGVGSSADQEFAIQNTGSGNLRIDSMRVQMTEGPASEFRFVNIVYPLTIAGGVSQRVTLRWSPESTGPRNGVVILYSNDPTKPGAQVILRGVALSAPVITLPDTIEFGNVLTGTSADQTIVVNNTGSGDLRIDSIGIQAITGVASEFKIVNVVYPIVIGGGLNHQATIRWSPNADGYRSAQMIFYSNDPSRSVKQVFVQGTAVSDNLPPVFSNVSVPFLNRRECRRHCRRRYGRERNKRFLYQLSHR